MKITATAIATTARSSFRGDVERRIDVNRWFAGMGISGERSEPMIRENGVQGKLIHCAGEGAAPMTARREPDAGGAEVDR
jgi:hypothetical protein